MSEKAELIIDTEEIDDEDVLFLTPNHIKGVKFMAFNTFDYVTIKHCPTEKLNSSSLIGIFNSLKPGAEIYIEVNQPISVMLEFDSKQIEANLRLVGFENINYTEKIDKKKGIGITFGIITATKPFNKQNNVQIEIAKKERSYTYQNDKKKENNLRDLGRDGGYRGTKKFETKEEVPNRFKKGRYSLSNYSYNNENEDNNIKKKYNRFSKKEEEPKSIDYKKEVVVREENYVRPKRYGTVKKEIVIEKTTVVDKKSEMENKKAGLRKRYGKH